MKARQWYRFQAAAEKPVADLYIYDDIGKSWWNDNAVTAAQLIDDLKALDPSVAKVRVHINSLGGDVFEGIAIANALRAWQVDGREVETIVDGIAASIASVVMMAGTTVSIGDNAMVMVHAPWSWAIGNAKDMRKVADTLDDLRAPIVATYRWHSQLNDEELNALIDGDDGYGTWMDADAAIANGFASVKIEGLKAAASIDPRAMASLTIPDQFKARVEAFIKKDEPATSPAPVVDATPEAATPADVLRLCREAAVLDLAETLVNEKAPLDAVTARIAQAKQAKADAAARAAAITALCAKAQMPELAAGYIAGAMTPDAVKAHLVTISARVDKADIDTSLSPDHGAGAKSRLNVTDIYAKRNGAATPTH